MKPDAKLLLILMLISPAAFADDMDISQLHRLISEAAYHSAACRDEIMRLNATAVDCDIYIAWANENDAALKRMVEWAATADYVTTYNMFFSGDPLAVQTLQKMPGAQRDTQFIESWARANQ